mmetsp:Transcript_148389/g.413437  ORF Transcript_148389/g.413437 Transcript_148389/m.413437 type:complete len:241 (+) Transcript_148389:278-1000(+)
MAELCICLRGNRASLQMARCLNECQILMGSALLPPTTPVHLRGHTSPANNPSPPHQRCSPQLQRPWPLLSAAVVRLVRIPGASRPAALPQVLPLHALRQWPRRPGRPWRQPPPPLAVAASRRQPRLAAAPVRVARPASGAAAHGCRPACTLECPRGEQRGRGPHRKAQDSLPGTRAHRPSPWGQPLPAGGAGPGTCGAAARPRRPRPLAPPGSAGWPGGARAPRQTQPNQPPAGPCLQRR